MKVNIRAAEINDAETLQQIYTSQSAIKGLLQLPYTSVEYYRDRIKANSKSFYQLVATTDHVVAGTIGLKILDHEHATKHIGKIFLAVSENYQKQKVGTQLMQAIIKLAFGHLNLHRLELEVFLDNEIAINLYKKFGFEIEGKRKDAAFRDGKYIDEYLMGLLANNANEELKK